MKRITKEGFISEDGREFKVDAIVCATGFDTSFKPAFPVIGRKGQNLRDFWAEEPRHYLSVAAPGFPNYFSKCEAAGSFITLIYLTLVIQLLEDPTRQSQMGP